MKIRKMFSGNNTCTGFYSFYHHLFSFSTRRLFILKGGPGTGKSTLMKKIGLHMATQGHEVEYHYCSSDNTSLDGLLLPSLAMGIVDGTEPHVLEPQNPGAVGSIINLGDFWREDHLVQNKEKIIALNQQKKIMFQLAYSHLREIKTIREELAFYDQKIIDFLRTRELLVQTIGTVFGDGSPQFTRLPQVRHLFASANTPDGYVTHLVCLLQEARYLYLLQGNLDRGKEEFLQLIYEAGFQRGLDCELYHCPFDPTKLELVYFPGLKVGLLRINDVLTFQPQMLTNLVDCREINFTPGGRENILKLYQPEINEAQIRLQFLYQKVWAKLKMAQTFHNRLEQLYFPAIDFNALNRKGEELLQKILDLSQITPTNGGSN